jgi:hypothetical protein
VYHREPIDYVVAKFGFLVMVMILIVHFAPLPLNYGIQEDLTTMWCYFLPCPHQHHATTLKPNPPPK